MDFISKRKTRLGIDSEEIVQNSTESQKSSKDCLVVSWHAGVIT